MYLFVQVWEGTKVVKTGRVMLGETNPANSLPGTIRGDFCIEVGRSVIGLGCLRALHVSLNSTTRILFVKELSVDKNYVKKNYK